MKERSYELIYYQEFGDDTRLSIQRDDGKIVMINIPFDYLYKEGEFVIPSGPFGLNLVFGKGAHYD